MICGDFERIKCLIQVANLNFTLNINDPDSNGLINFNQFKRELKQDELLRSIRLEDIELYDEAIDVWLPLTKDAKIGHFSILRVQKLTAINRTLIEIIAKLRRLKKHGHHCREELRDAQEDVDDPSTNTDLNDDVDASDLENDEDEDKEDADIPQSLASTCSSSSSLSQDSDISQFSRTHQEHYQPEAINSSIISIGGQFSLLPERANLTLSSQINRLPLRVQQVLCDNKPFSFRKSVVEYWNQPSFIRAQRLKIVEKLGEILNNRAMNALNSSQIWSLVATHIAACFRRNDVTPVSCRALFESVVDFTIILRLNCTSFKELSVIRSREVYLFEKMANSSFLDRIDIDHRAYQAAKLRYQYKTFTNYLRQKTRAGAGRATGSRVEDEEAEDAGLGAVGGHLSDPGSDIGTPVGIDCEPQPLPISFFPKVVCDVLVKKSMAFVEFVRKFWCRSVVDKSKDDELLRLLDAKRDNYANNSRRTSEQIWNEIAAKMGTDESGQLMDGLHCSSRFLLLLEIAAQIMKNCNGPFEALILWPDTFRLMTRRFIRQDLLVKLGVDPETVASICLVMNDFWDRSWRKKREVSPVTEINQGLAASRDASRISDDFSRGFQGLRRLRNDQGNSDNESGAEIGDDLDEEDFVTSSDEDEDDEAITNLATQDEDSDFEARLSLTSDDLCAATNLLA